MDTMNNKKTFGIKSVVIVGIASLLLGVVLTARFDVTPPTGAQSFWKEKGEKTEPQQLEPNSFVKLAKELNPVVVNISTTQVVKQKPMVPFPEFRSPFEDFFGDEFRNFGEAPEREFKRQSLGSGFIINKEGYILTNNHVVENAEEIIVTLSDKKEKEYKKTIRLCLFKQDCFSGRQNTHQNSTAIKRENRNQIKDCQYYVQLDGKYILPPSSQKGRFHCEP